MFIGRCKLAAVTALIAFAPCAIAQQTTGVPGSPGATTTIDGKAFGGIIKEKASESKPWWPPRIVPPKGAPNVLRAERIAKNVGRGIFPGEFE